MNAALGLESLDGPFSACIDAIRSSQRPIRFRTRRDLQAEHPFADVRLRMLNWYEKVDLFLGCFHNHRWRRKRMHCGLVQRRLWIERIPSEARELCFFCKFVAAHSRTDEWNTATVSTPIVYRQSRHSDLATTTTTTTAEAAATAAAGLQPCSRIAAWCTEYTKILKRFLAYS